MISYVGHYKLPLLLPLLLSLSIYPHSYLPPSAGRQLYQTSFGTPVCQCPTGTYEGDDDLDDDVCEPLLGQTLLCPQGQVSCQALEGGEGEGVLQMQERVFLVGRKSNPDGGRDSVMAEEVLMVGEGPS